MALTYDLSRIKNKEVVCYLATPNDEPQRLTNETRALIEWTQIVGMSDITEKNAAEFAARMIAFHAASLIHKNKPMLISERIANIPIIVAAHVGLSTNAVNRGPKAWWKGFGEVMHNAAGDYVNVALFPVRCEAAGVSPVYIGKK